MNILSCKSVSILSSQNRKRKNRSNSPKNPDWGHDTKINSFPTIEIHFKRYKPKKKKISKEAFLMQKFLPQWRTAHANLVGTVCEWRCLRWGCTEAQRIPWHVTQILSIGQIWPRDKLTELKLFKRIISLAIFGKKKSCFVLSKSTKNNIFLEKKGNKIMLIESAAAITC